MTRFFILSQIIFVTSLAQASLAQNESRTETALGILSSVEETAEILRLDLDEADVNEIVAEEKENLEAIAARSGEIEKIQFFKDYASIKQGYRTWHKENAFEARSFLKKAVEFRRALRKNSAKKDLSARLEACNADPACSSSAFKNSVVSTLKLQPEDQLTTVNTCETNSEMSSWHAIVYGQSLDCSGSIDANIYTIGLGLMGAALETNLFVCSGPQIAKDKNNWLAGAFAQGGFVVGAGTGILFGSQGICFHANYSLLSFGAAAGLKIVKFQ